MDLSTAQLDKEVAELTRVVRENACMDLGCQKARVDAALLILRGPKVGAHRTYADNFLASTEDNE